MGALVRDPAAIEQDHAVGEAEGRDAVGDDQAGPTHEHLAEPAEDLLLGERVDGAGGVVEHQDPRIGEDRAGEGDALALATAQAQPALADRGVVAVGELEDEVVGAGDARGLLDLRAGGVRMAVGDVGRDGVGEQEALLEGRTHLAAERVQGHPAYVVTVDQHLSLVGIQEPVHQPGHGGLAGATRPDERDAFPGTDVEVEPVEDRPLLVGEADSPQLDLAAHLGQLDGVGLVGDLGPQVEQLEDPLDARACLLTDRQDAGQLAGGSDELSDVRRERQEGADRDLVVQRHPAAEGQDRDLGEDRDRLEQRLVTRLQPGGAHPHAVQRLDDADHPPQLALLLPERLDHADTVHVLVDDLGDLTLALLAVPGGGEDLEPHPVGDDEQGRRDHQPDEGERR